MVQMRENMFLEKQKAIESMREDLDKGRSKTEERLQRAVIDHQKILKVLKLLNLQWYLVL